MIQYILKSILIVYIVFPYGKSYEATSIHNKTFNAEDFVEWDSIPFSDVFQIHNTGEKSRNKANFKIATDSFNIWFYFSVLDTSPVSTIGEEERKLWETDDLIELFIDPDGDGKEYLELGINPHGNYYDIFVECPHQICGNLKSSMDKNLSFTKILTKPIIDQNTKQNIGFTIQLCLNIGEIGNFLNIKNIHQYKSWKINVTNIDFSKDQETEYSSWSSFPTFGFHQPEFFGTLKLK